MLTALLLRFRSLGGKTARFLATFLGAAGSFAFCSSSMTRAGSSGTYMVKKHMQILKVTESVSATFYPGRIDQCWTGPQHRFNVSMTSHHTAAA